MRKSTKIHDIVGDRPGVLVHVKVVGSLFQSCEIIVKPQHDYGAQQIKIEPAHSHGVLYDLYYALGEVIGDLEEIDTEAVYEDLES